MKLDFAVEAGLIDSPFNRDAVLDPSVSDAIEWMSRHSPSEAMCAREFVTVSVEDAVKSAQVSGVAEQWFEGCDSCVVGVSQNVCGPVMEQLGHFTKYKDVSCVQLFRTGSKMLGVLPCSGMGVSKDFPQHN